MPFFDFKCCECHKKKKIFVEYSDINRIRACECGYMLIRVFNSKIDRKNENPPYQTAEDCIDDSKNEVMKGLEAFKKEFEEWK